MSKKSLIIRFLIFVILLALTVPAFTERLKNEKDNTDVVFALNYNNADMLLSNEELDVTLEKNKNIGVNTVVVAEESLNSLINSGSVSAIKYNVLCHKYDDESEQIVAALSDDAKIHNDSYVLITKRPTRKEYLRKWITSKYNEDEYTRLETTTGADVYAIYGAVNDAWHVPIGFDEEKIENAYNNGFDVVLSMMVGSYSNTAYISEIEELIEKYDVKFLNLKKAYADQSACVFSEQNYKELCRVIEEKDLYLVLTEEQTQLSNQKPIGYAEFIASADGKVLRAYETVDFDTTNAGATMSEKRCSQIVNSVVDRNIRFVVINQLSNGTDTNGVKGEKTNIATANAISKLNEIGFNTNEYNTVYNNYTVNRTFTSAAAMLLMIFMGITMLEWLAGKKLIIFEIICAAGALLSIPFTYVAPERIILLYPTLFAIIAPCFAISVTMVFIKNMKEKLSGIWFGVASVLVALGTLLACSVVQCALLGGLDYYINSLIFQGIKISLIVPIAYSMVAYPLIFNEGKEKISSKVIKFLNADIKVYWMLLAMGFGAVALVYLIRSGNVESISGAESLMRDTITEFMPARPRTKEFLIGWPCLVLFLYYVKNTNVAVVRWILAVGSSILFASVINSFCHVFTSAGIIYSRMLNGVIIGAVVSVSLLIVNHIVLRIAKKHLKAGK